jgi:hypothetical protein
MIEARRFLRRIITLFRSSRADAELSREINAHLRLLEDDFIALGMNAADARYGARRTFGGVEQAKERQRDARAFRWLAGWPMDLRLGARMLVKYPGLTVLGGLALAFAIAVGAAAFEVLICQPASQWIRTHPHRCRPRTESSSDVSRPTLA